MIGINSVIVSPSGGSVGIGFAIPSNSARRIVAALIAHGEIARGWLGISVADPPDGTGASGEGAQITGVVSPAGLPTRVGLSSAGVVLSVDGQPVSGRLPGLTRAIASMAPGTKVVLGI